MTRRTVWLLAAAVALAGCGAEAADPAGVLISEAPSSSVPDYDRDAFGPAWADVDRNGCDTRNDVLRHDLHDVTLKPGTHGCVVLTGTLDDPYTGHRVTFVRGPKTSNAVQIDHVVALGDAWRSGAWRWTAEQRRAFANDPSNLLAVDGPTNESKSDDGPDEWLPPAEGYRCAYARQRVAVKLHYSLTVTPAESDALAAVLATCD